MFSVGLCALEKEMMPKWRIFVYLSTAIVDSVNFSLFRREDTMPFFFPPLDLPLGD